MRTALKLNEAVRKTELLAQYKADGCQKIAV